MVTTGLFIDVMAKTNEDQKLFLRRNRNACVCWHVVIIQWSFFSTGSSKSDYCSNAVTCNGVTVFVPFSVILYVSEYIFGAVIVTVIKYFFNNVFANVTNYCSKGIVTSVFSYHKYSVTYYCSIFKNMCTILVL